MKSVILAAIVSACILAGCHGKAPTAPTSVKTASPQSPVSNWNYEGFKDSMTGDTSRFAEISSSKSDTPGMSASLNIGLAANGHKTVFLQVHGGIITCEAPRDNCTVLLKMDNSTALGMDGTLPNNTRDIFDFDKDWAELIIHDLTQYGGKKIMIRPMIYQQPAPTFTFDVSGIDEKRLETVAIQDK
jgi:hypothetical protein